jgi:ABC-type lipoprotein release transport system permease subunit
MRRLLAISATGLTAVLMHPTRSAVTVIALVAVLVPYLAGLGISRGVRDDTISALRCGADLHVAAEQFGNAVPMPASSAKSIGEIEGVQQTIPRIVGRIELGKERVKAVLIGIPVENFPQEFECIEGRLYAGGKRNELVIGSDLARALSLTVGSRLPPFYRSRSGEHVSEVVGIFRADAPMLQARLIVTSLETAARIFDQPGLCTDVLVYCRPGYAESVRASILRQPFVAGENSAVRIRVTTRDQAAEEMVGDAEQREGVLTLFSVVAFAVAILVVLITSGFGFSERRREIGILKATGWQTDELLLRSMVESLTLALAGAAAAIVLAFIWLEWLNGIGLAGVFLPGLELAPSFRVPFRLAPEPALLCALVSVLIIAGGSLYSTWRSAIVAPREAMR